MEKLYTLKTFLKMAGEKMHTPHPTPWIHQGYVGFDSRHGFACDMYSTMSSSRCFNWAAS